MERTDPAHWQRAKELFLAALAIPPDKRDVFLAAASGADRRLRDEVTALLVSDTEAGSFIEKPASILLAEAGAGCFTPRFVAGAAVGRYEILEFLGAGGIGEVYRARDTRLGRTVAIKIVTDPADPLAGPRLLREAQHASRLSHPHICAVHEVEEIDGLPFIVLEYVEGDTLRDVIKREPPSIDAIVRWGVQIASALDHAHRRGIIHRDLKSSNVALAPDRHVKVLDFGLSRRMAGAGAGPASPESILSDASVAGTLTHMAPEILQGQPLDARVDLWALGVMLYEMVAAGALPFRGATPFETAKSILNDAPDPLPTHVSPGLRGVIDRCLAKDPAKRFQTAAEVREALDALGPQSAGPASPGLRAGGAVRWVASLTLLIAALSVAAYLAAGRSSPAANDGFHVLAVLPFEDASGDLSQQYFADGLTEGLIAELGRIDAVRVISSTTTMRYRHRPGATRDIAREAGAGQVLQGSVARAGDRVRIAARLLEASTGRVIWSEEYERPLRHLQALHGAIAGSVSRAIAVRLTADDATRLATVRAVDPDVYEAYLKGRYHWNQRTEESLRTAVGEFQTALMLDPTYAPAYAALADCYNLLGTVMVGGGSPQEWRPLAAEAAIKALQIDPGLAEAHAALGYVRHYNWEWDAAEQSLRRAIALNPSYALAHTWYANLLSSRLRLDEAVREVTVARELDPLSLIVNTNVGWVLYMARRNDEAIAQLKQTLALDPNYVQAHSRLGTSYGFANRHQEAIEEHAIAVRLTNNSASSRVALAQAYALGGRGAEAQGLLDRALSEIGERYVSSLAIANVYVALGRKEEAFAWLEKSSRERANGIAYLAAEPLYDRVRHEPRFQALVRSVGLP